MQRVISYIDGFNLYHGITGLYKNPYCPEANSLKYPNLWSLSEMLLRENERLDAVHYFTAFAKHRPESYQRHKQYVALLEGAGVTTHLAHFKRKPRGCRNCGSRWWGYEEKETDVRLALKILADAIDNQFDRAILVSADSDLVPAVNAIQARCPQKRIFIATPPGRFRTARGLFASADGHGMEITKGRIRKAQFPGFDPYQQSR